MGHVNPGISAEEFIDFAATNAVIDVRTPSEYQHGHFPGAFNLPLFEDDERARVGTLYHHTGRDAAILLGLEIIGPRLKEYVEKARELAPSGKILMYCWRGGMRSNSLAWLLNTSGMDCKTLLGGYKAYRNKLLEKLTAPRPYLIIGGMTGSGKTDLLQLLRLSGEQVLDLEALASHKGSAFGAVGMQDQPSQETFENELFNTWNSFDPSRRIWMEDESIRIGRLYIPRPLYDRMCHSPVIQLQAPAEERLQRLVRDYSMAKPEVLAEIFSGLRKRLGEKQCREAISLVLQNDLEGAAQIALQHYDKVYSRQLAEKQNRLVLNFKIDSNALNSSVIKLIESIKSLTL